MNPEPKSVDNFDFMYDGNGDRHRFIRMLAGALFLICVLASVGTNVQTIFTSLTARNRVESSDISGLTLKTADGKSVVLKSFVGKPLFIYIWADFCSVCKTHLPEIDALSRDKSFPAAVISIALDSQQSNVMKLIREESLTLPVLFDEDGNVEKIFSVTAFPTIAVLDDKGKVIFRQTGIRGDTRSTVMRALGNKRETLHSADADAACFHHDEAESLQEENKNVEAMREYELAVKANPNDADSWHNMGHLAYDTGDNEKANAAFSRLAELDAHNVCAMEGLAKSYADLGDFKKAVQWSHAALNEQPDDLWQKTIVRMIESRATADPEAEARYKSGLKLYDKNKYVDAEKEFRAALRIAPGHIPSLHQLGHTLMKEYKYKEARIPLERILVSASGFRCTYRNLAYVYSTMNLHEKSVETCRKGLMLEPDDEYLSGLVKNEEKRITADTQNNSNVKEESVMVMDSYEKRKEQERIVAQAGELLDRGETDKAISVLEKCYTQFSKDSYEWEAAGDALTYAYIIKGQYEKARKTITFVTNEKMPGLEEQNMPNREFWINVVSCRYHVPMVLIFECEGNKDTAKKEEAKAIKTCGKDEYLSKKQHYERLIKKSNEK